MKGMREMMQHFSQKSVEVYKRSLNYVPTVIVADQSGMLVGAAIKLKDSEKHVKSKKLHQVGTEIRKQVLKPLYGIIIAEAMLAPTHPTIDISEIDLSTYPNSQEILFVSGIDFEYNQVVYMHEIIRDASGKFEHLNLDYAPVDTQSPLLVALMSGLQDKPFDDDQIKYDGIITSKKPDEPLH